MGAEQSNGNNTTPELNLAFTKCRIVVVGPRNFEDALVELAHLPREARIIGTGSTLEELKQDGDLFSEANVILNVAGNAETLPAIINEMPFLVWIHSITAGVDHILCNEIVNNDDILLTNAKGIYSSPLAEYVMTMCLHFAKDVARLMKNKEEKVWDRFQVAEVKGKTMGIVGYGNIGLGCAKLAKAFGMKVIALRKTPSQSNHDRFIDEAVGADQLNELLKNSDYVVVALALTKETRHFLKQENFKHCKENQVLINIGRGALIDEDSLVEALQTKKLFAAALDVFSVEPLPESSPLWTLPNAFISPHNADLTCDARHRSIKFFTENCKRFLAGEELECIVNKQEGY